MVYPGSARHTDRAFRLSGSLKALKRRGRRGQLVRKDRVPLLSQLAFLSFPFLCEGDQTDSTGRKQG